MNRFEGLLSFADASKLWGLKDSTLRKALQYGKFKENIDCKKFGRDWIVTIEAMERVYGKLEVECVIIGKKDRESLERQLSKLETLDIPEDVKKTMKEAVIKAFEEGE